jgi:hypothetical protein
LSLCEPPLWAPRAICPAFFAPPPPPPLSALQVLQPAALLSIPDTTLEEALAILGQSAATPAPAPAP